MAFQLQLVTVNWKIMVRGIVSPIGLHSYAYSKLQHTIDKTKLKNDKEHVSIDLNNISRNALKKLVTDYFFESYL